MRLLFVLALAVLAAPVLAQEVKQDAAADVPLPRPRPEAAVSTEKEPPPPEQSAGEHDTAPKASEPRIFQTACPAVIMGLVTAKPLPPLSEGSCGERSPLELESVTLAMPPWAYELFDCRKLSFVTMSAESRGSTAEAARSPASPLPMISTSAN